MASQGGSGRAEVLPVPESQSQASSLATSSFEQPAPLPRTRLSPTKATPTANRARTIRELKRVFIGPDDEVVVLIRSKGSPTLAPEVHFFGDKGPLFYVLRDSPEIMRALISKVALYVATGSKFLFETASQIDLKHMVIATTARLTHSRPSLSPEHLTELQAALQLPGPPEWPIQNLSSLLERFAKPKCQAFLAWAEKVVRRTKALKALGSSKQNKDSQTTAPPFPLSSGKTPTQASSSQSGALSNPTGQNNCYLNATLQILCRTPPVYELFLKIWTTMSSAANYRTLEASCATLHDTCKCLSLMSEKGVVHNQESLAFYLEFKTRTQNDQPEFFIALFNKILADLQSCASLIQPQNLSQKLTEDGNSLESLLSWNLTYISKPDQETKESKLEVSERNETSYSQPLNITNLTKSMSDSVRLWFVPHQFNRPDGTRCSTTLSVTKVPAVALVHFVRHKWDSSSNTLAKNNKHMKVTETFNWMKLRNFQPRMTLVGVGHTLIGVTVYSGTGSSGHWEYYFLQPGAKSWSRVSDTLIESNKYTWKEVSTAIEGGINSAESGIMFAYIKTDRFKSQSPLVVASKGDASSPTVPSLTPNHTTSIMHIGSTSCGTVINSDLTVSSGITISSEHTVSSDTSSSESKIASISTSMDIDTDTVEQTSMDIATDIVEQTSTVVQTSPTLPSSTFAQVAQPVRQPPTASRRQRDAANRQQPVLAVGVVVGNASITSSSSNISKSQNQVQGTTKQKKKCKASNSIASSASSSLTAEQITSIETQLQAGNNAGESLKQQLAEKLKELQAQRPPSQIPEKKNKNANSSPFVVDLTQSLSLPCSLCESKQCHACKAVCSTHKCAKCSHLYHPVGSKPQVEGYDGDVLCFDCSKISTCA